MAKRGRPRKEGPREKNGKLSRRKDYRDLQAEAMRRPMIEARARLHGLNETQARDQKAETVIGRYCLMGQISESQWQAADQYYRDAAAYSAALQSPRAPVAVDMGRVSGSNGEETTAEAHRAAEAKRRYSGALAVVVEAELVCSGVSDAVATVVLKDIAMDTRMEELRVGLDRLAYHYGFLRRAKRA